MENFSYSVRGKKFYKVYERTLLRPNLYSIYIVIIFEHCSGCSILRVEKPNELLENNLFGDFQIQIKNYKNIQRFDFMHFALTINERFRD
jgi:hypothetical protein